MRLSHQKLRPVHKQMGKRRVAPISLTDQLFESKLDLILSGRYKVVPVRRQPRPKRVFDSGSSHKLHGQPVYLQPRLQRNGPTVWTPVNKLHQIKGLSTQLGRRGPHWWLFPNPVSQTLLTLQPRPDRKISSNG